MVAYLSGLHKDLGCREGEGKEGGRREGMPEVTVVNVNGIKLLISEELFFSKHLLLPSRV